MSKTVATVTVPRDALRMLYECAVSYDRRIPEGNGGGWAEPFHALFAAPSRIPQDKESAAPVSTEREQQP